MQGQGRGWVTAEYGMLPASTGERKQRDVSKGRPDGRTVEIQRLIGRSLRGVVDFEALGERTVWIDCDVLEADGGTRCASITGGYVALELALRRVMDDGQAGRAAADAVGRRGLVRRGRRAGAARPRLLRGLDRRGRRERRHDRRRRPRRGPGDGRAHAALARVARRAARARGGRHRAAARGPAGRRRRRSEPPPCRAVLATRNAHKLRELARLLRAARAGAAARRGRAAARDRHDVRRQRARSRRARRRPRPGGRRSPTTPASRPPRSAARPACCSARFAGEDATDEENLAKLLRDVPADGDRRVAYVCALAFVEPGGREEVVHGRCEGTLAHELRGEGGFGYDPAFVPDDYPDDERTMAELSRRREGRDQPPRPRRPRAAGAPRRGRPPRRPRPAVVAPDPPSRPARRAHALRAVRRAAARGRLRHAARRARLQLAGASPHLHTRRASSVPNGHT